LSTTRPANHHHVKPAGDSAGQPLNRVFERYTEENDRIWRLSLGTALGPFRIMDRIGLDVALAVEEHYATIRDGISAAPRELLRDYVDNGFLGVKSGTGFYDDYGG